MAELFLIRHPRAQRPLFQQYGELYGLTLEGEEQARQVGQYLLEIVGSVPISFERATSKRSEDAAKIIAGIAGIPTPITPQDAFNRTGYTPTDIQAHMEAWMAMKKENGAYVAVMSRAAIVACISQQLGWSDDEIMSDVSNDRSSVPTGSVTHLTVDPTTHIPFIHYYGLMPQRVLSLPEHIHY